MAPYYRVLIHTQKHSYFAQILQDAGLAPSCELLYDAVRAVERCTEERNELFGAPLLRLEVFKLDDGDTLKGAVKAVLILKREFHPITDNLEK